jgi:transcriptional regulator with XRE-family HTH domain
MGIGQRIRDARVVAGLSQGRLAEAIETAQTTISSWERGRTEPTRDDVVRVADVLGISVAALELGEAGEAAERAAIPIVGYVGAASEYFGFDDHAHGSGLDEIERPPGVPERAVAVIVRGDSGYPAIREGMVLVYWNCMDDPSDVVGEDCFVRLKDGRTLVKLLERGSSPGLWTLVSINTSVAPIRDVEIEWAAPIEIRLRRKNWKDGG